MTIPALEPLTVDLLNSHFEPHIRHVNISSSSPSGRVLTAHQNTSKLFTIHQQHLSLFFRQSTSTPRVEIYENHTDNSQLDLIHTSEDNRLK